ncbi:hypothetical protein [Clostridiisalibacter paucivorans]|uniref:hypothetical protein n=1 Tax=Clostridiisalibacter paucivorans TaxID=408753 RepID=UPI00047D9A7A|nr:hypothetical protein [Clostridiisalibacter paucivorans]
MWTTVHIVDSKEEADEIMRKLQAEGFLIKTDILAREGDLITYQILAPEFEADDIQSVILELNL